MLLAQLTDGNKIVQIKILVTPGKEQEAGYGLTHGLALCWQVLLWWQGLICHVQDSSFLWSFPFLFLAPSVTESQRTPVEKAECLSSARLRPKRVSFHWVALKKKKKKMFWKCSFLMTHKLILIPLKVLVHLSILKEAILCCITTLGGV